MNKALSIFNELRPSILGRSVGFDQIFDSFAKTFDDDFFNTSSNYPAYDIVKTGENKRNNDLVTAHVKNLPVIAPKLFVILEI